MFSFARAEEDARRRGAAADAATATCTARSASAVAVLELRGGAPPALIGPAAGARALRRRARARCPTSSRCAATPPTGCPGAPGVGAKTAAELLREHGTLEAVLAAAGAWPRRRPRRCTAADRAPRAARERGAAARTSSRSRRCRRSTSSAPGRRADRLRRRRRRAERLGMRRLAERLARLATA